MMCLFNCYVGKTCVNTPQLKDLVLILDEVDWHKLGTQLNVPPSVLSRIDKEYKDISRKLNEMLQFWLANAEEPSWNVILCAVQRVGDHKNLCLELEHICDTVVDMESNIQRG